MSKRGQGRFKGHCVMCATFHGKLLCDGQSHRKPVPERRFLGRKRRVRRHDLGYQEEPWTAPIE